MKYTALIGWGIVIYAIVFLVWTGFITYGFIEGVIPQVLIFFTGLAVTVIAGLSLRMPHWADILPYSIGWAIIVAFLDVVYVALPFGDFSLFTHWQVWVGYALVVIAPLLSPSIAAWLRARGA